MLDRIRRRNKEVTIAIVGKYVKLHDAYLSIMEALHHAGYENSAKIRLCWVDAEELTDDNAAEFLSDCDGILVPGGFGDRGIEGKIKAARYARENNIPYFGICLGMQIAVIEFARHVAGLDGANSSEFDPEGRYSVIDLMPDQQGNIPKGGTMRLGSYPCKIKPGTIMARAYQSGMISERHRHRYEFNNRYREILQQAGLLISGTSPDGYIVETIEIPQNDFFIGVQFHPEFKSRPNRAHPLFREFVAAALKSPDKMRCLEANR